MLEQLAAPTVYPVSLATAKGWLRETTTDSDADISRLIKTAVARVERVTHNAVVARLVREQFDSFRNCMELTGYPVLGVRSITYLDTAGVKQTLAPATYVVDVTKPATRITPAYSQVFPVTYALMNAVQVNYDIGLLVPVVSVDIATDRLNAPGHNKLAGDVVQLSLDGAGALASGALPGGLTAGTVYYVVNPVGDTFQLSATSGGAAIDLTGAMTAPVFVGILADDIVQAMALMMDTWHRNRSDVSPNEVWSMPAHGGAEALLAPYMARGFQ